MSCKCEPDEKHYPEYPEKRLAFHFGDKKTDVEAKLYEHDLILEYNKTNDVKLKKQDKLQT
mgnify:CR=1 FL=1